MFTIRQTQMEVLERAQIMRLVEPTARRIQTLKQKMQIQGINDIPVFVAAGFEAARRCGLETEEDLAFFVECQAIFGSRFERDPTGRIEKTFSCPEISAREKVDTVRGILCFEISDFWREVRQR